MNIPVRDPERLNKKDALKHWRSLAPGQDPAPLMEVIPYKSPGSKYGTCGIRIDGHRAFIDAVLSNLQPLMALENQDTRLELNYTETKDRDTGVPTGQWVCYVRVHQRGGRPYAPVPQPESQPLPVSGASNRPKTWMSLGEALGDALEGDDDGPYAEG